MSKSQFNHVKVSGVTAVVPEHFINIDDELEFCETPSQVCEVMTEPSVVARRPTIRLV